MRRGFIIKLALALSILLQQSFVLCGAGDAQSATQSAEAFSHFRQSAALIEELLQPVQQAELHFFWATGRTLSDNSDYSPDTKVEVGGADYGHKFFPYIDALLVNSPSKLKVKFVCDAMTQVSNELQIKSLCEKYGPRFEVVDVRTVHENLLGVFTSAQHKEKIDNIFKNATQGAPVITSDIYRIIGMIYGHGRVPHDLAQTQYTYCDIDTFCYGMEQQGYIELLKALFASLPGDPFYFGKSHNNNDLIRLQVSKAGAYKNFCEEILDTIRGQRVLTYFNELHAIIRQFEEDVALGFDRLFKLERFLGSIRPAIMNATGSYLLKGRQVTTFAQQYPEVYAGEWRAKEEVLDNQFNKPVGALKWRESSASSEEKKAEEAFELECNRYRVVIAASLCAKRFGANHPFNLAARRYLLEQFPANSKAFKELMRLNFEDWEQPVEVKYRISCSHPIEDLNDGDTPEPGCVWVYKCDGSLRYSARHFEGTLLGGVLDIPVEGELREAMRLRSFHAEVLRQAAQQGLKPDWVPGLSYDQWKKETFRSLRPRDSLPKYHGYYDYGYFLALLMLLDDLGISVPFTEDSIDFMAH